MTNTESREPVWKTHTRLPPAEPEHVLKIQIHKSSPVPLYFQIAQAIREDVRENNVPSGAKLMTEGQLARQLKVATGTVRQAMQWLAENLIVVRVQGSGTYVA